MDVARFGNLLNAEHVYATFPSAIALFLDKGVGEM